MTFYMCAPDVLRPNIKGRFKSAKWDFLLRQFYEIPKNVQRH